MRDEVPSRTAAWVAGMRGLGAYLPPELRLVQDPYGLRFAAAATGIGRGVVAERVGRSVHATSRLWMRGRLEATTVYMQLRTRRIDDDVQDFIRAGGRQLVLLGAGFDCRAWRLPQLDGVTVFEVDHPATQGLKRRVMERETPRANVTYVPWHFEREPLDRLPARLALDGHDAGALTMTISEGVLMYLTDGAVEATFDCIARLSSPGSRVTFSYMDRTLLTDPARSQARERWAVRAMGEPFRHGFEPAALPAWLRERGFDGLRDESSADLARRMLPPGHAAVQWMETPLRGRRHFASATRTKG